MRIVALDLSLEPIFWEHVKQDIPYYYFFAFDWKYNRDETNIWFALEENRIVGMMLIYRQSIVQLRGSQEAAKALLEKLDLEKVELQALEEHEPYVLEKYKPTVPTHRMMLMLVHRGEETLHVKHPIVTLNASDAERIVSIMVEGDPEFWGTITAQQVIEGMSGDNEWVGVKVNGELASIGRARVTELGGVIGIIATGEKHRNKGYATSITSALVKRILEEQPTAMIYVLVDNPPAIRAYEKVGFRPYKTYFFMRGEKR